MLTTIQKRRDKNDTIMESFFFAIFLFIFTFLIRTHGKKNFPQLLRNYVTFYSMRLYYIFIIISFFISQSLIAQGLKFRGNEHPIDKRTSLDVFKKTSISFTEKFDIDFDLSLDYQARVGHILRIKNKNYDKIYNVLYEGHGGHCVFRFNEEGKSSLIIAEIDKNELINSNWIKVRITLDLANDLVELAINNHKFNAKNLKLDKVYEPEIIFGKSDYVIDVPSFAIKQLSIGNDKNRYIFPLNEYKGNMVHDSQGQVIGEVSNPEWLINDAYRWQLVASSSSQSIAGSVYNEARKEIYYFNKDSIFIYNTKTNEARKIAFENKCPVELRLATNFIDTKLNRLYVYEVYYNTPYTGPTVASLDLNSYKWKIESHEQLNRELHHHGAFYDADKQEQVIFGGYGNNMYSNTFYTYNLESTKWTTLKGFSGNIIFPRYFLSTAYNSEQNSAYIFGGMGNETGEHIVGRKYLYDLYKVNFETKAIKKLWQITWQGDKVVPARNLVLSGDTCFYALCYPEHVSESFLKLYRFSLKDGAYKVLGDSISIYSDKITTNAKLYYDKQLSRLFVIVQESKDDIASNIKVYSLIFPAISAEELVNYPEETERSNIIPVLITFFAVSLVIGYGVYRKVRKKRIERQKQTLNYISKEKEDTVRANSIFLFGEFTVFDRQKRDITYLFSSRLKQTLCLILEHSNENGITSQRLSNILWPEKDESKVKNSRGVTMNHLRKAISELDGIELIHSKGFFKIVQTEELYCDYTRCIQIISNDNYSETDKTELFQILNRGKFLKHSDNPLFDSIKSTIESKIEPLLLVEIEKSYIAKTHHTTIELAEAIFNIDSLNDTALSYIIKALIGLKMENEARLRYMSFIVEYRKTMGDEYPHSFQDLA